MNYFDEGMAHRGGKHLDIQCLLMDNSDHISRSELNHRFHYHKYTELIYVMHGCVNVYIGNEMFPVCDGSLITIYPDEPHDCNWTDSNKYIVIKFLPEILSTGCRSFSEFEYIFKFGGFVQGKTRIITDDENIGKLMQNAYESFAVNSYCSELTVRADVIKICAHILDLRKHKGEISVSAGPANSDAFKIVNNIASHAKSINGAIRTHEAAKMCNMSDGHFSRIFKSITGKTFTEYTKSVKIAEAERLLKCTNYSVTDIAQKLGYATASHFIEDFKKEKGVSPGKYKF